MSPSPTSELVMIPDEATRAVLARYTFGVDAPSRGDIVHALIDEAALFDVDAEPFATAQWWGVEASTVWFGPLLEAPSGPFRVRSRPDALHAAWVFPVAARFTVGAAIAAGGSIRHRGTAPLWPGAFDVRGGRCVVAFTGLEDPARR